MEKKIKRSLILENFISNFIESYGYFAVFSLIFIENVFPPIPSEVILLIGGFFVGRGLLGITGTVLSATLGSVVGAYILYGIGRLVPTSKIYQWAETGWMRKLGFQKSEIEMVVEKFETKGKWLVLIGRCIPIVRSLISIPAGMVKMPILMFTLLTAFGSLVWNIILVYLGYITGENWHIVIEYLDIYKYVIAGILVILFIAYMIWHFRHKKSK